MSSNSDLKSSIFEESEKIEEAKESQTSKMQSSEQTGQNSSEAKLTEIVEEKDEDSNFGASKRNQIKVQTENLHSSSG